MCIYCTSLQTTLEPITLAIFAFGFSALVVVEALQFVVLKGKTQSSSSLEVIFLGMAPLVSIHDGPSVL
jgi:hypothetical protein